MSDKIKPWVLGLCGYAGVGKDEAFKILERRFEHVRIKRVALADLLKKDMEVLELKLKELFPGFNVNKPEDKERFRRMWVAWGETLRAFDPNIWLKRASASINALLSMGNNVVVTDVRYLNEINYLETNYKAKVVYISRTGYCPNNDTESESFREIYCIRPELMQEGINNSGGLGEYEVRVVNKIAEMVKLDTSLHECEHCRTKTPRELTKCINCGKMVCRACLKIVVGDTFVKACPICYPLYKGGLNAHNK